MAVKKVTPKKSPKRSSPKKRFDLQQFLHYFYWVLAIVSVLGAAGVVGFYAGYNQAKEENACVVIEHKKETKKLQQQITRLTNKTARHEYGNSAKPPKHIEKKI